MSTPALESPRGANRYDLALVAGMLGITAVTAFAVVSIWRLIAG